MKFIYGIAYCPVFVTDKVADFFFSLFYCQSNEGDRLTLSDAQENKTQLENKVLFNGHFGIYLIFFVCYHSVFNNYATS